MSVAIEGVRGRPGARIPASPGRDIHGMERIMLRFGETMGADLVIGRVSGPIDREAFRRAAAAVVRRHPTLRVRVEGKRERFVYGDRDTAPVSVEICDGPWQQVALRETRRPFALAGEPACRFLLVRSEGDLAHAIVAAPHAIVDGRCLMRLLEDLLTAWAAALRGEDAALPELPITPAAFTLIREPLLHRFAAPLLRQVWLHELRSHQARPALAPGGSVTRDGDLSTLASFREGTPEGFSRLQAACRAHQVTVGGALLAATWFAVSRLICDQQGRPPGRLTLDLDVDLRGHVEPPVPDTHVGFYTGQAPVGGKASPRTDFWTLARRLRSDTTRSLRWKLPELVHLLPEEVPDYFDYVEERGVHRHRAGGTGSVAAVSNVGRFPYDPVHGPLRLTGIWGFNGATLLGPALISWLRFLDGKLFYNVIGSSPSIDQAQLERFQDAVFELLERAPEALSIEGFCRGERSS